VDSVSGGPGTTAARRYRFDDLSLDTGQRRVRRGGDVIPLTALSFDLLRVLVEDAPNVVDHEQLASRAWGARRIVSPENLAKRVMLLRQALGDQADQSRYIEGVRGRGYRLIPEVQSENVHAPVNGAVASGPTHVDTVAPHAESVPSVHVVDRRYWFALAGVAVVAVAAVLIALAPHWSTTLLPALRVRAEIPAPGYAKQGLAVAPDGKQIAYVTVVDGVTKIAVRTLDDGETRILGDTTGAQSPFWSPDSRSLAFYAGGMLKRIDASGGPAQTLAEDVSTSMPGAWGRDGTILFAMPNTDERGRTMALARVSATRGAVTLLPAGPPPDGETVQVFPQFLPDGKHFIYSSTRRPTFSGTLRAGAVDEPGNAPIMPIDRAAFHANGFLLFRKDRTLFAQRFDAKSFELRGDAMTLAEDVDEVSVSEGGVIVYDTPLPADAGSALRTRHLVWVDRDGRPLGEVETPPVYELPELSPDSHSVAVTTVPGDIWTIDVQRGNRMPLTFDVASDVAAVWSPDGTWLAYGSGRNGMPTEASSIYRRAANGTGPEDLLFEGRPDENLYPTDWSRDERFILFARGLRPTKNEKLEVWVLDTADRTAHPLITAPFFNVPARLSPDGRWLAYSTNESGESQVIVVSFPDVTQGRWPVSKDGGQHPRWRADGRELYYRSPQGDLMAVDIDAGERFDFGTPHKLFAFESSGFATPYNVASDGSRFLIDENLPAAPVTATASAPEQRLHLILNWTAGLPE
jgi:Tol biopolymer transport system component/DNA-binding winged helix-turn-helix (wHTH) protein